MFAFPSPPVDSDLIPGIERKISAVALGAACSICAPEIELTETLDCNFVADLTTPVTTISSMFEDCSTN